MKNKHQRMILDLLTVIAGNFLYALGVTMFITPVDLITGGATGLGIFVNHYTGFPVAYFVLIFNVVMFVLGWIFLGKRFALTTVVSTFAYPIALAILGKLLEGVVVTDDTMLCALFGGLCIGVAIGVAMRAGSSTGGMDIPVLIINKYTKIPVSVMIYLIDVLVIASEATFTDGKTVLYGIFLVFVYSIALDRVVVVGQSRMQLQVVSRHSEEIRDAIRDRIDRGVTFLHGKTGYLGDETDIILSVVSSRELPRVERLIRGIDPEAFVMISRISEVRGKGFSSDKKYLNTRAYSAQDENENAKDRPGSREPRN